MENSAILSLLEELKARGETLNEVLKSKDKMAADKDKVIADKDEVLKKMAADKDKVIADKDEVLKKMIADKDELHKKVLETEISKTNLKHALSIKNTEYLRVTRSLHLRSVCEEFEKSLPMLSKLNTRKSRREKWTEMLQSDDIKCVEIKNCLEKCGLELGQVPQIAVNIFEKINNDVHGDFRQSGDNLYVVTRLFEINELKLIKCIIECYGISHVVYAE
ncbi:uncharacterized protein [Euwallacea similis]|uniref:uncharacterized protein n=1 Tax=Euwallacea similis TaxID=1736056 RepID=UPI00344D15AB